MPSSKKKPVVLWQMTNPKVAASPAYGSLFAVGQTRVNMHIPNGWNGEVDCGVTVSIPDGVTVEVLPDPAWEASGVRLVPQKLIGPVMDHPIKLLMFNHAGGAIRLENGEELAQVVAYESPPPVSWELELLVIPAPEETPPPSPASEPPRDAVSS